MKSIVNESLMNKDYHLTEMIVKGKPARIYDNCLPLNVFKQMQNTLLGAEFSWHWCDDILTYGIDDKPLVEGYDKDDIGQFSHEFYSCEDKMGWPSTTEVLTPILNIINPRAWMRVKANLGPRNSKHMVGGWHCDKHWEFEDGTRKPYPDIITAIFYLNTNNGYTMLETGDKIESVENRFVLFFNDILHTGMSQTDTKVRVVINFSFLPGYGPREIV